MSGTGSNYDSVGQEKWHPQNLPAVLVPRDGGKKPSYLDNRTVDNKSQAVILGYGWSVAEGSGDIPDQESVSEQIANIAKLTAPRRVAVYVLGFHPSYFEQKNRAAVAPRLEAYNVSLAAACAQARGAVRYLPLPPIPGTSARNRQGHIVAWISFIFQGAYSTDQLWDL